MGVGTQFGGEYYEQVDGVPVGSPLSPAIANFYMERFKKEAIRIVHLKPSCFFRYEDVTFEI